ncbi:DUF6794 domain-containing protein [Congregicoccus parvus]|uniref:DUF6794 domain-containing protein n=1 Tax=Congregicoccus parvus TaxID=3081749 RepID=UPI003FA52989
MFIPPEEDEFEDPWRLEFGKKGSLRSEILFAGVRQEQTGKYKEKGDIITCTLGRERKLTIRVAPGSLVLTEDDRTYEFVHSPEWDDRFAAAPPIPKTKEEAIQTLLRLYPEEGRQEFADSREEDLIGYHHGFGTTIRNAFGLWESKSPLRRDLGGGHPDNASMVLIRAFWQRLQEVRSSTSQTTNATPSIEPEPVTP